MGPNMRERIEKIVDGKTDFHMLQLASGVWPLIEARPRVIPVVQPLRAALGINYAKLANSILRNTFLIELVRVPKIETTKFRVRWFNQLDNDPRYCAFEECLQIAEDLVASLPAWIDTEAHAEALALSFEHGLIPYEAPLDYRQRLTQTGRLHERGNLTWFYDDLILQTLRLRKYLTEPSTSPDYKFFRQVLSDKIKVKTYLTDRVLTGGHKTNREKRWETHPKSVHFAERRTCMAVEYALVTQICAFEGFPATAVQQLQQAKILPFPLSTALCPITGDALSYDAFRNELLSPKHGKSDFQVGHLNPLKLEVASSSAAGHSASNISWISADGNRMQGSLSLSDVRSLIKRIAENYERHGW
jgi:hypothetical protein